MKKRIPFFWIFSVFLGLVHFSALRSFGGSGLGPSARSMEPDQAIGQLFFVEINPETSPRDLEEIKKRALNAELRGVIFVDIPVSRVKETMLFFRKEEIQPHLFCGIDFSRGFPDSLFGVHPVPSPASLGCISDERSVKAVGYEIGVRMQSLGLDFVILPRLSQFEGNGNFKNYIGSEASDIARVLSSLSSGMHLAKILPVVDFDFLGIAYSPRTESLFNSGYTFQALQDLFGKDRFLAIGNLGESAILRDELGFEGLVMSRAFNEKDKQVFSEKNLSTEHLFHKGISLFRFSKPPKKEYKTLRKVIEKNGLDEDFYAKTNAILNIDPYGNRLSSVDLHEFAGVSGFGLGELLEECRKSALVTVDPHHLLPIIDLEESRIALLEIRDPDQAEVSIRDQVERYRKVSWLGVGTGSSVDSLDFQTIEKWVSGFSKKDYLIINYSGVGGGQKTVDLISGMGSKLGLKLIHIYNGVIPQGARNQTFVFCPDRGRDVDMAVAEILFGGGYSTGRMAFSSSKMGIPSGTGFFLHKIDRLGRGLPQELSMDQDILVSIDDVIEEALTDSATPGGQVMVVRDGNIIYENSFGNHDYEDKKLVMEENIYDIASVTKVAGTLQAIMKLYEWGVLDLDSKASQYLPELKGTNKEDLIVRDVLVHQAGLKPYIPFWAHIMKREDQVDFFYCQHKGNWFSVPVTDSLYTMASIHDSLWHWTIDSELLQEEEEGGYKYRYSDLSFYILLEIAERLLNQPIEHFLEQNQWDPIGISRMSYNPLRRFDRAQIIPTEVDHYFRNQRIQGTVHDQGAALLGGVGGHAGLFSNSLELAKLFQMNMNSGNYGARKYFRDGTVELFTSQDREKNRRGLGWDKPNPFGEGPTSELCSYNTFGHSGFTGTMAWADPDFDLVYVFLSNRTFPDASNRKLIDQNIRTRIQDLIYDSIFKEELEEASRLKGPLNEMLYPPEIKDE